MEEINHTIDILSRVKIALEEQDSEKLKMLSDRTIHSASVYQHTDSILLAIVTYSLSKILERKEKLEIKNWQNFIRDISNLLDNSINAIRNGKYKLFTIFLEKIEQKMQDMSLEMKPMILEVIKKAYINKASKIYEHGISVAKTTKLLGISPWELTEYIAEKENLHLHLNKTIDIRNRAQMALEFLG
jgi:hypothetical protein